MADNTILTKIKAYFTAASTRENLTSGEELQTSLGKVKKWFSDLGTAAFTNSTDYAAASHNQASSTINAMTGYSKPQATSAITATDTLNEAIGKLEKAIDGAGTPNDGVLTIQQNGTTLGTFSANQASNETINIQAISTIMTSSAVNTSDGTTTIEERKTNVSITDSISYSNLATGSTYTLKTRVYDATTGDYLSITKDGVTSTEISTTITPTANNGAYINTFSIDSIVGVEAGTLIGVDEVLEGTSTGAVSFLTVTEVPKVYGFKINKNDTNPDTRVEYMYDAIGMTPAYMDFTNGTFNYGSWGNVWFISENRPVALKYDGTVDYELDHTDFTKKLDGTASDVSSTAYAGNFMSEMPTIYVKRWEDSNYNYMAFSKVQIDSDYLAQAHTNANGVVNSHIYLPMFKGYKDSNNKLRSLMGTYPKGNTKAQDEVTYASNCGGGWQLWDKAKIDLIMDLIVLITKSTNSRAKIGYGNCMTYDSSDANYGKMKSGYETDGSTRSTNAQFYGYEGTETTNYGKHHMIAFYIEDLWGNRCDRCLGFNFVNNEYRVKMTPPYSLNSDGTYTVLSVSPPSSTTGWLKNVSSGIYGDVPTEIGASNITGFACNFYKSTSGIFLAMFGGGNMSGLQVSRFWLLGISPSDSYNGYGGSPCYSAP